MCRLASFIVTKNRILRHPSDDQHEAIINYHQLRDDPEKIVCVEIAPKGRDYLYPMEKWEYKTDQDILPAWYNAQEAEIACRSEMTAWAAERPWFFDAMRFVATIKNVKWFDGHGPVDPEWKMFDAGDRAIARDSAGASAGDIARAIARDSARDSARDIAGASARDSARDSAGDIARAITRDIAGDSARDIAREIARDSARDATLLAQCIVVEDKIDPKHLTHARARWDVWERGYGLLCDVDGVLYVYRKL